MPWTSRALAAAATADASKTFHVEGRGAVGTFDTGRNPKRVRRRGWALTGLGTLFFQAQAKAKDDGQDKTPPPLVQELLRRSEEKREERYKERLRDYYRRNYKDYFAFESRKPSYGTTKLEKRIQDWLRENDE